LQHAVLAKPTKPAKSTREDSPDSLESNDENLKTKAIEYQEDQDREKAAAVIDPRLTLTGGSEFPTVPIIPTVAPNPANPKPVSLTQQTHHASPPKTANSSPPSPPTTPVSSPLTALASDLSPATVAIDRGLPKIADGRLPLGNQTNLSRPRSTRGTLANAKNPLQSIPSGAVWLNDAMAYIRSSLKDITCVKASKLVDLYLKFERSLGYPVSKVCGSIIFNYLFCSLII
jgi:hypothetical protein